MNINMHSSPKNPQKTNLNQVQIEYAHAFTFSALKSFSKLKAAADKSGRSIQRQLLIESASRSS